MKRTTHAVLAGACTIGAVVLSSILLEGAPPGAARVVVALFAVPFMAWFLYAELALVRSFDEFHRRVLYDALAIAFPAAIFLAVVVEALQKAGVLSSVTVGDLWPVMALVFVPTLLLVYRHYDRGE